MIKLLVNSLTIVLLFSFQNQTSAQSITPDVISNGGEVWINTDVGSLSWTLGEMMVETYSNDENVLTQGFQQNSVQVSSVKETLPLTISVFPNPVASTLFVKSEDIQQYNLLLTDAQGSILLQEQMNNNPLFEINLNHLPTAIYLSLIHI